MRLKSFFFLFFLIGALGFTQAPEKFTYQSVIKNSSGYLLKNQEIGLRISILFNSSNGMSVYSEEHSVESNSNGLVTLIIGEGVTSDVFNDIDWGNGEYYLKVEVDPEGGLNYTMNQSSQLLSVPYALYAGNTSVNLSVIGQSYITYSGNQISANKIDASNDITGLSAVAISGEYVDLANTPTLFDGDYANLTNTPTLFDGDYSSLTNTPTLFDGDYANLTNTPTLFDGDYSSLTNTPTLFDGDYANLTNTPTLFDGDYSSLTNTPTLFDGDYANLTNTPTLFDGDYSSLTNTPTLFDGDYANLTNTPTLFDGDYSSLTNTPTLFDGDYANLSNKPELEDSKIYIGNSDNKSVQVSVTGDIKITNAGVTSIGAQKVVNSMLADDAVGLDELANITDGSILIGGASNAPTEVAVTGDVTITNAGVTSIGAQKVVNSMLADDAVGLDELANITDGSILIGGASNAPTEVAVTGDVTITNAGVTSIGAQKVVNSMLADDAVGLDELANITDGSILIGGASNAPTEVAVTGDVTITNAGVTSIGAQKVVNSMLADDAVGLDELANITDGSILIGGASNAPTEVAVTGDVTITNAGVTSIGAQKVVNSMLADDAVGLDELANITDGSILIGGASNAPTEVAVTGDVTITNAGVTSIGAQKVVNSMLADDAVGLDELANIAEGSILTGDSSNNPLLLDANDTGKILVGTGNGLASVAISGDFELESNGTVTIANNSVTNAKIANATIDLAAKVTGVLPIAQGGTGANSADGARTSLGFISGTLVWSNKDSGSGATATFSVSGISASSIVTGAIKSGGNNTSIYSITPNTDEITFTLSGTPSSSAVIMYISIN
jgi:hypothetical protein